MSTSDIESHMAILGVKLDSRDLLKTDGLQVQLMQILQLMAEYGLQFKEVDKRLEQNTSQIRDLKSVFHYTEGIRVFLVMHVRTRSAFAMCFLV